MRSLVFLAAALSFAQTAQQKAAPPAAATQHQKTKPAEPLWQKLLRVSGISATPSAQRGPEDEPKSGRIWVTNLDDLRSWAMTSQGGFRSPVGEPRGATILALKQDTLIRIGLDGGQEQLFTIDRVRKLVGFDRDDPDEVLGLLTGEEQRLSPAFISLTSKHVSEIPVDRSSADWLTLLNFLKGSERVYGSKRLRVVSTAAEDVGVTREWTDVYLRNGDAKPVNVSRCDGVSCGQPSLSADGRLVYFIKAEK